MSGPSQYQWRKEKIASYQVNLLIYVWSYKKLLVSCILFSFLVVIMGRISSRASLAVRYEKEKGLREVKRFPGQGLYYLGWRRWSCRRTCPWWSAASPSGSCSRRATRPPARQEGNSLFFFLRFSLLGSRQSRCAPCRTLCHFQLILCIIYFYSLFFFLRFSLLGSR